MLLEDHTHEGEPPTSGLAARWHEPRGSSVSADADAKPHLAYCPLTTPVIDYSPQGCNFDRFGFSILGPKAELRLSESCYRLRLAAVLGPERWPGAVQPWQNALMRGRSGVLSRKPGGRLLLLALVVKCLFLAAVVARGSGPSRPTLA